MTLDDALSLNVGICQINSKVGDLEANALTIVEAAKSVKRQGADIAVFPELAICGYPPEDLLLKPAFIRACENYLRQIAADLPDMVLLVGYPEDSRRLYNSAGILAKGSIQGSYRKRLLPNYSVFDEQRYFVPGNGAPILYEVGGVLVGVSICEDIWSPVGPALEEARGGADLILNLNASPYSLGRRWQRASMLATRASDLSTPIVYVNLVGGQDELVFDGGSMVFDETGALTVSLAQFDEVVETVRVDVGSRVRKYQLDPRGIQNGQMLPVQVISVSDKNTPKEPSLSVNEPERVAPFLFEPTPRFDRNWVDDLSVFYLDEVLSALRLGLHDYVFKNSFSKVVIGLSGGIDSSICAAIAAQALGPERVIGIAMPSRYNLESSLSDAAALAQNLGVEFLVSEIEPVHETFGHALSGILGQVPQGLTDENLQSRIRGVMIMAYSNSTGALVITTGNKSETATGYSTLYGDSAGGFALIKDVPKLLVYRLCRRINQVADYELIPSSVLDKPPSAELRPNQRDDQSLPPYEVLDPILMALVERDMTPGELIAEGYEEKMVLKVASLVDKSEYKRRQGAPGVRLTPKSFGKDRRMPITNGFDSNDNGPTLTP